MHELDEHKSTSMNESEGKAQPTELILTQMMDMPTDRGTFSSPRQSPGLALALAVRCAPGQQCETRRASARRFIETTQCTAVVCMPPIVVSDRRASLNLS